MSVMAAMLRDGGVWAAVEIVKGTLLLIVVFGAAASLRRASAAARHLVWSVGIVAVVGLPLISAALPWRLGVLPAPSVRAAPSLPANGVPGLAAQHASPTVSEAAPGAGDAAPGSSAPRLQHRATQPGSGQIGPHARGAAQPGAARPAGGAPWWPALPLLLGGLWALGATVVLARLLAGTWVLRRVVGRASPLDSTDWTRPLFEAADRLGLARAPALLTSDRLPMPFVCGLVRPAIVLPRSASEWSDRRRRAVLLHELAHVRRFDLAMNVLGRMACALHWFNPLVWIATRRMRAESERAADDMVLSTGTRASEYAEHLLKIVCRAGRSATPAVALPMAQRREFEGRMLAILEAGARRHAPSRRHAAGFAGVALAVVLPVAALSPAAPASARTGVQADTAASPSADSHVAGVAGTEGRPLEEDASTSRTRSSTRIRETTSSTERSSAFRLVEQATSAAASTTRGLLHATQASSSDPDSADARLAAALVRALGDSARAVRVNAAYALGERELKSGASALGARLRSDESPEVREMCAWALGEIESRDATSALAAAVREDPDVTVRTTAVWALGETEDETAVPALAAALSDSSVDVRGSAAWALGIIEPRTAPPELVRALRDPSASVRKRAAWALGQIEDASVAPAFESLLRDSDDEVRRVAIWALGNLDSPAAREVLLKALDSPDPAVRARALRALSGTSDPWPWPWPRPRTR
jgi:HEAT repeat protein/beta-lactamase regulating signal transducer with metallopeptidase domain